MIFLCPSCKQKRWLPARTRTYFLEQIKQNIQSEVPHCYKCRKAMKNLMNKMK